MAIYKDILKDKVVVITGTTSGIVKGMAKIFAKQGAKILGSERREDLGNEVKKEIIDEGEEVIFIKTDVTDHLQIRHLIDKVSYTSGASLLLDHGQRGYKSEYAR